jgi:hypothetical protein
VTVNVDVLAGADADAVSVTVLLVVAPVSVAGDMDPVTPVGKVPMLKSMSPVNPPLRAAVTVNVALPPATIVTFCGMTDSVKPGVPVLPIVAVNNAPLYAA